MNLRFINDVSVKIKTSRSDMVEKDILLHQILTDLSKDKFFSRNFLFKGGTCLIKHHLGYLRFSEDIDFTWKDQSRFEGKSVKVIRRDLSTIISDVGKIFESIAQKRGFDFKCKKNDTNFVLLGGSNRMQNRTKQFIHKISKKIVDDAVKSKSMIVLEDLKGIRKLYKKGNGQGKNYRRKLNGWQFYELQRQIEYKANWEGIPVVSVDPKRTSKLCPICEDRIQEDYSNKRKLLCINCGKSMDRDVIASMNIAHKGWARFIHPRGDTCEAQHSTFEESMMEPRLSNINDLVIRIVDVSKLGVLK